MKGLSKGSLVVKLGMKGAGKGMKKRKRMTEVRKDMQGGREKMKEIMKGMKGVRKVMKEIMRG
jgi:hypothetical protein